VLLANGGSAAYLPRIFGMLGLSALLEEPRFATNEERAKPENGKALYEVFCAAFMNKTAAQWVAAAAAADVPLVKMNHFEEVNHDPQAWANGYLEEVTFRNGMTATMPRSPISMNSVGDLKTTCAPHIGADTEAVLHWLGYTEEDIEAMKKAGAIDAR
jgi:crotonobetainyl-CoA:carnitine CoA-transferase CaiB-like acyl-CoA transferase